MIGKLNIDTVKKPDILLNQLKNIAQKYRKFSVSLDRSFLDQEADINSLEIPYYDVPIEEKFKEKEGLYLSETINNNLVNILQSNVNELVENRINKLKKAKVIPPMSHNI